MDVVARLRVALSNHIGSERYDLWVGDDTGIDYRDGTIRVTTDSAFKVDRLKRAIRADLAAVAEGVLGTAPRIEFEVVEQTANGQTELNTESVVGSPARVTADERPATSTARPDVAAGTSSSGKSSSGSRRFSKLSDFIVGDCNRLANSAAKMVLSELGATTPLFLYGPTGVGKSHLLEGVWCSAMRSRARRRCLFLSAEQFTTYFLEALRGSGLPSFRRKCREVDLLVIDNLHFFRGKNATIVELLHTVDTLLREGRQLVMAADRPVNELAELGTELTTRIASGLVCPIEALDDQTKRKLVRRFSQQRDLELTDRLVGLVAERAPGDARQLSGVVNRLKATSLALEQPVCERITQEACGDLFPASSREIRLADIEREICKEFSLAPRTLQSSGKARRISQPRMLAMWLARKYTRSALTEISEHFGRRSHSSVVSAQRRVEEWITENIAVDCGCELREVRSVVRKLERKLRVG